MLDFHVLPPPREHSPCATHGVSMYYTYVDSPVGRLLLAGTRDALHAIGFSSGKRARGAELSWERWEEPFRVAAAQLEEYFRGERRTFDLPVALNGSAFQIRVWRALTEIPYGETRSYRDVAIEIGRPTAVRAVGAANGRNPLPIIIPCHRVIGHDGHLTGFGGGLATKQLLLELEQRRSGLFAAT
jgi:methylated-DNA-[protein]-cysteine S-methyltransferase